MRRELKRLPSHFKYELGNQSSEQIPTAEIVKAGVCARLQVEPHADPPAFFNQRLRPGLWSAVQVHAANQNTVLISRDSAVGQKRVPQVGHPMRS